MSPDMNQYMKAKYRRIKMLPKINSDDFVGLDKGYEMFIEVIKATTEEFDVFELWAQGKLMGYCVSPAVMFQNVKETVLKAILAA
jgi:hypothetical protein